MFESDQLYDKYIAFFDPETKGVPDVFLDGTRRRIQGATSVSTTRQRIEEQLADLLITNSYFTIESALRQENDRILPAAKFARLGTEAVYNLLAKVVILEEISSPHLSRVVRKVLKSNIINTIAPGEIKEIAFESYTVSGSNPVIVVYQICSADELNVYYTQEVRLK